MKAPHRDVAARAQHRCEYCHAPEAAFNLPFEVEHIVPVSRGGSDRETNLALACRSCNLFKSAHVAGFDAETEREVRLLHPREDEWEKHFRVEESGEITGLTPVGRVTVARLGVNSAAQLAARRQWMRLDLFP